MLKIKSTPTCPYCHKVARSAEYPTTFFEDAGRFTCGHCGTVVDGNLNAELVVPEFIETSVRALSTRHGVGVERFDIGPEPGAPDDCIGDASTIHFAHHKYQLTGLFTWFEIKAERKPFVPHNTDFAALERFVPVVSAMLTDLFADGFVVSESPGKEGRRMRDDHIRLLKYVLPWGRSPRFYVVRGFFTWVFQN